MANAARITRFALMLLASMFGLYSVFMGFIALILHLCKLKSIGVPYLTPFTSKTNHGLKDTLIRYPIWKNESRPDGISVSNSPRTNTDNPVSVKQKGSPEFR
jgi:spore germination protein KA